MIDTQSKDRQVVTTGPSTQIVGQVNKANLVLVNNERQTSVQTHRRDVVGKPNTRTTIAAGSSGPRGLKGDKGDKGEPGGSIPPINFSYGDASSAVWTFDADGVVSEVRIVFRTAFNGASPSVLCGTAFNDDSFMPANFNDPTAQADFDNTPDTHVTANTLFWLTINPGAGATQGNGTILITFLPD